MSGGLVVTLKTVMCLRRSIRSLIQGGTVNFFFQCRIPGNQIRWRHGQDTRQLLHGNLAWPEVAPHHLHGHPARAARSCGWRWQVVGVQCGLAPQPRQRARPDRHQRHGGDSAEHAAIVLVQKSITHA